MTAHGMLSLADFREDGSACTQVWLVSDSDRAFLAELFTEKLGDPYSETIATREGIDTLSDLVVNASGHVTSFPEEP